MPPMKKTKGGAKKVSRAKQYAAASRQAGKIERYWRPRRPDIRAWPEWDIDKKAWVVRSNLAFSGQPRKRAR
jgi:hypothetical protein